jgi:hypothetical protein
VSYLHQRLPAPARKEIEDLIDSHRKLTQEPLLLAMYYNPNRNHNDIFIFEVLDRFGDNLVDPDGDFFEVEFGKSTSVDIRLPEGSTLHLVLTNPVELMVALNKRWPKANELVAAISRDEFEILFEDAQRGSELRNRLLPPEAAE